MKHSPLKGTTTFLYSSNLSSFFYFLKTCYLRLLLKEKKIIYIYIVVCSLDTKNSCNHPVTSILPPLSLVLALPGTVVSYFTKAT